MAGFQEALKRLIEDPKYSAAVIKDPTRLHKDFKNLVPQEMLLLMQVWHATGSPDAAMNILELCHCCTSSLSARTS